MAAAYDITVNAPTDDSPAFSFNFDQSYVMNINLQNGRDIRFSFSSAEPATLRINSVSVNTTFGPGWEQYNGSRPIFIYTLIDKTLGTYTYDPLGYAVNPAHQYDFFVSQRGFGAGEVYVLSQYRIDISVSFALTPLFTSAGDAVNFNGLSSSQLAAISANPGSIYDALGGNDTVTLPDIGPLQFTFDRSRVFSGGAGNDTITGSVAADKIDGAADNDTLYGSPGNDFLFGGDGNDVFDYQNGAFKDYLGFAAGTVQTLDGGADFGAPGDVLRLPGSPSDYDFVVEHASTWGQATTTVRKLGPNRSVEFTFKTKDIEKAILADAIENKVELEFGSLALEAAKLAKEVYGTLQTLNLADGSRRKLDRLADEPNYDRTISTAAEGRNWHAVAAMELGLKPADYGEKGTLRYTFDDGHYLAFRTDQQFLSDRPGANALVLTGLVDGKPTLAVAFRGTDQYADFLDYSNFGTHYEKFRPLVDSLKLYIAEKGIQQVLVTGHSLGAGMVQRFMNELGSGVETRGFTFGSPGSDGPGANVDPARLTNFVNTDDAITLAPGVDARDLANTIALLSAGVVGLSDAAQIRAAIAGMQVKDRPGAEIGLTKNLPGLAQGVPNLDEHDMGLNYLKDLRFLAGAAGEQDPAAPFPKDDFAKALTSFTPYTAPNIQIAPGTDGNDTLLSDEDDRYVLAGAGQDLIKFESLLGVETDLVASGQRIIDGGTGGDRLFLPYGKSVYQVPTVDGGDLLFKPINGPTQVVGTLHRIEVLAYANGDVDVLNKATPNAQNATPGQSELVVDGSADYTDAGDGDLTVTGSSSGDTIVGRAGRKTVNAGAGDDIVLLGGGADGVGGASAAGSNDDKVDGGEGNDILSAGVGADQLSGGSGNDDLYGGAGDDLLDGGAGADKLVGGTGNDTYLIDDVLDQAFELAGEGTDTVLSMVTYALTSGFEHLTLIGSAAISATGNQDANLITGNSAANTLIGQMGNDILIGGAGNDLLLGGGGADLLYCGDGLDWAFGDDGNDVLVGGKDYSILVGGAGDDYLFVYNSGGTVYGGAGHDVAVGNNATDILVMEGGNDFAYGYGGNDYFYMGDGADVMYGGDGGDVLVGEAGNDWFDGGAGTDYLFLGSGDHDVVVFNAQSGVDVVNQFETGNDVIYLQGTPITSFDQVLAATTDYGSFSVISIDPNSAIWLTGVSPSQLLASDFAFL